MQIGSASTAEIGGANGELAVSAVHREGERRRGPQTAGLRRREGFGPRHQGPYGHHHPDRGRSGVRHYGLEWPPGGTADARGAGGGGLLHVNVLRFVDLDSLVLLRRRPIPRLDERSPASARFPSSCPVGEYQRHPATTRICLHERWRQNL